LFGKILRFFLFEKFLIPGKKSLFWGAVRHPAGTPGIGLFRGIVDI
jgi:hypothetical protein